MFLGAGHGTLRETGRRSQVRGARFGSRPQLARGPAGHQARPCAPRRSWLAPSGGRCRHPTKLLDRGLRGPRPRCPGNDLLCKGCLGSCPSRLLGSRRATQPLTVRLSTDSVSLSILDRGRVALDPDPQGERQVEGLLVRQAKLACQLVRRGSSSAMVLVILLCLVRPQPSVTAAYHPRTQHWPGFETERPEPGTARTPPGQVPLPRSRNRRPCGVEEPTVPRPAPGRSTRPLAPRCVLGTPPA